MEELNDLDIARELKSGSVIISASGLPNHVSISIRTVDAAQESGDMSTDQHVAEVTGGTYYVVATNREHYTDSQLGRWATESWRDRFQEYAPLVAEATERVKQRLKQPNCQSGTARLVAIQQWKQEGSLVFDHMDKDELAVTFSVAGGFKFCARCAKCRALFAYRMCSECNKLEEDLSSLEGIVNGNTCSEGLLHLLRVQARAEISKGTAGRAADNENEKAVDGHGGT